MPIVASPQTKLTVSCAEDAVAGMDTLSQLAHSHTPPPAAPPNIFPVSLSFPLSLSLSLARSLPLSHSLSLHTRSHTPALACAVQLLYTLHSEEFEGFVPFKFAGLRHVLTTESTAFQGIAMDAIIMNLDDLLCVGATDNILLSSTIGRNKNLVTGDVLPTPPPRVNNWTWCPCETLHTVWYQTCR